MLNNLPSIVIGHRKKITLASESSGIWLPRPIIKRMSECNVSQAATLTCLTLDLRATSKTRGKKSSTITGSVI